MEDVREVLWPPKSTRLESIKCLGYDKGMSFSVSKFWSCDNKYLFLGVRFQISISNVCGPYVTSIEFCNEGKDTNSSERYHTGVYWIHWGCCEVTSTHESFFVLSIVLHRKDEVTLYPLVFRSRTKTYSLVGEGFVFVNLYEHKFRCVEPLGVSILMVVL